MLLTYFLKYAKFLVMRSLLVLSLLMFIACTDPYDAVGGSPNKEKPLVIAVIDTGFGYNNVGHEARLCKYGHKDFSHTRQFTMDYGTVDPVPRDFHGHGTNVTGLIESQLRGETNYCIVVVKFYEKGMSSGETLSALTRSIAYVGNIRAKLTNHSGGGPIYDAWEYKALVRYIKLGGTFVAAAGNEGNNLDDASKRYYPAQYDPRVVVVGNENLDGKRHHSSNYGSDVDRWELGVNMTAYGITMTGTSQATAIATGKIAREMLNVRK